MKPSWISVSFGVGLGRPPGGWTKRGMNVGKPELAEAVEPVCVVIPVAALVRLGLELGSYARLVGTTRNEAESVPVGMIDTGAVDVRTLDVGLGVELGSSLYVEPSEVTAVEVAVADAISVPELQGRLMVAELVPTGTTVVVGDTVFDPEETLAGPLAVIE